MAIISLRKLLFVVVCLVIIFDLILAYYYFFNTYWVEIFSKNPGFTHVHSWGISDTIGTFVIIIVSGIILGLAYKTWFPKMKPKNLISFRKSITAITGFVVVCNIIFTYNVLFHKSWDIGEWMEYEGIFLTVAYFTVEIVILITLIAFQIGLGILTYKAWSSESHQSQAVQAS